MDFFKINKSKLNPNVVIDFSEEKEVDIWAQDRVDVPSNIKPYEVSRAIDAHFQLRQAKIKELEQMNSDSLESLNTENSNTTQATLKPRDKEDKEKKLNKLFKNSTNMTENMQMFKQNINDAIYLNEKDPLYDQNQITEFEKLEKDINPNDWANYIDIQEPSKRDAFLNSARSLNNIKTETLSSSLPTHYKEDVKPVSRYIYTPFIHSVKEENERLLKMKEQMKKTLLAKIDQSTDYTMKALHSNDKQKFLQGMIEEYEMTVRNSANLSVLDKLTLDLVKYKANQVTKMNNTDVKKKEVPSDLSQNNNYEEVIFLNLDSQYIMIALILVAIMGYFTLMIDMFLKSTLGIVMYILVMLAFSIMLISCLTVKLYTELRVYQNRELKNNVYFYKYECTMVQSLLDRKYACSDINTIYMYHDVEKMNFFVDCNSYGELENLFFTTDEGYFTQMKLKLQRLFRPTIYKEVIVTDSPYEEKL